MVIGAMITLIEVFNHRISIQIVVIIASNVYGKEWEFTLVDTSLNITRILPIKEQWINIFCNEPNKFYGGGSIWVVTVVLHNVFHMFLHLQVAYMAL